MKATRPLNLNWIALTALLGVGGVMAFNIYTAVVVSVVPSLVDGWAVWNRVILFNAGAISWQDYIFKPHGAHLHSIVYLLAWFDYQFSGADQTLMRFFSLTAVAIFAATCSCMVWVWGGIYKQSPWVKTAAVVATAALLTSVVDAETLIQPFQAVLSISRLAYFALLGAIVHALVRKKPWLYVAAILLSMVAVTFHGSGYIFAGLVIVAHVLLTRRPAALVSSVLPLAAVFIFQKLYSDGGSELSQLHKVFTPGAVLEFIQAASAYCAMPFRALRGVLGDLGLVALGVGLMLSTATLTVIALVKVLSEGRGFARLGQQESEMKALGACGTELLTLAVLAGLFLLLSAAAAAVFWIIRTAGPNHLPAYMEVFVSTRYTAYATLGLVLLIGYGLTLKHFPVKLTTLVLSVLLLVTGLWPAIRTNESYLADDQLNRAATAISVGISPLHPEAEVVWPQASKDWYWSNNLPKTIATLRLEQKNFWKGLPPLGATINSPVARLPLALTRTRKIDDYDDKCGIEGTLPVARTQGKASAVFAVVNASSEVVGYVNLMRHKFGPVGRRIDGFLVCKQSTQALQTLFLAAPPLRWHGGSTLTSILPSALEITDATWAKGVAKAWAGLVVAATPESQNSYRPGAILRFADGQLRVVSKTTTAGPYLNVFIDGSPLDGNVNGFPAVIELVN